MAPLFKQATGIGVGLIGGSIAGAMRLNCIAGTVVGVGRSKENMEAALLRGLIDRYTTDAKKGVAGSDIVILCSPVGTFEQVAKEIKPYLTDNAIVTDTGSVKGGLVKRLEEILYLKARFVPAHPIAGGERSGADAADTRLFQGSRCIVTPTKDTDAQALDAVTALWEAVGANVVKMDPDEHARVFALVSHLPHMAAYALVGLDGGEDAIKYAAGGFKDFTRIAGSHPEMWRDICLQNGRNIAGALDGYIASIERLRDMVERGDGAALLAEFEHARAVRARIT